MISIIVLFIVIYPKLSTCANYTGYITTSSSTPFNFIFNKSDYISSTSGNTQLLFEGNDGDFALYYNGNREWSAQIAYRGAEYVEITRTGDISIRDSQHNIIWQANTYEHNQPPYYLIVNEACAYLMDANNYVLWNQGSACVAPLPTWSPRPTAQPTTSAPTAPTNTPTVFPTIAPTIPPTNVPSTSPTNVPSTTPTEPSSAPSRSPTLSPSKTPSNAPTMYPTVPTQAPTHARSLIDEVFTDDFVFEDLDGFGWLNDATVTDSLYHGPYHQLDGYWEMNRWFKCRSFSMVSIEYTLLCCKGNDHADVTVSINNNEVMRIYCDTTTYTSSYAKHPECANKYYARGLRNIGDVTVTKHEAFEVTFKIHTLHESDPVAVADIKVYCGDAVSDSPTEEPTEATSHPTRGPTTTTTQPTPSPSDAPTTPSTQPTKAPTCTPSTAPTTAPSAQPTAAPSVPTINPTTPTIHPTYLPSLSPTRNPSIPPSIDPTIVPTVFPSVSPTADPTIPPTKTPTTSPTALTMHPTLPPTRARTTIDDVFTDDFIFDGVNGFGWFNDATVTDNLYHGPYVRTEGNWEMNRWFECSSYSRVYIEYRQLCCKLNDHADISVYINDNKVIRTYCEEGDWSKDGGWAYDCVDEWYVQNVFTDIGNIIAKKHESFHVGFQMHTLHDNDPIAVADIKVYCGDALYGNPTTKLSTDPTGEPSVSPRHVPTKKPSNKPSLFPSFGPSASPILSTLSIEEDATNNKPSGGIMTLFILLFIGLIAGGVLIRIVNAKKKAASEEKHIAPVHSEEVEGASNEEKRKKSDRLEKGEDTVSEEKADTEDEMDPEEGDVIRINANVELQNRQRTDSEDLYYPAGYEVAYTTPGDLSPPPELQPGSPAAKTPVINANMVLSGSAMKTVDESDLPESGPLPK